MQLKCRLDTATLCSISCYVVYVRKCWKKKKKQANNFFLWRKIPLFSKQSVQWKTSLMRDCIFALMKLH